MKIVYCIGSLSAKGGTERVLATKTKCFIEKYGYQIDILVASYDPDKLAYKFHPGVNIHNMDVSKYAVKRSIPGLSFLLTTMKLKNIYENKIAQIEPDLVIVCERGFDDFILPKVSQNIPKIREFHFARKAVYEYSKELPFKKRLFYRLNYYFIFKVFNQYDYLVLLTNKDKLEGKYKTNTVVIPNMIELPSIDSTITGSQNKRVISVGSMYDDRKKFYEQIDIWGKIQKDFPDWEFVIFGDGILRKEYIKYINEKHLQNVIFMPGTSNNINKEYLNSSIFIFTSVAEGLPMVIIEAMSYGLPIISYDCPTGPSDLIVEGKNGFIIKNRDQNEYIKKLKLLMDNNELRKKMSINSQKFAQNYNPDKISEIWNKFFKTILSND